ncbi:MAG TPA: nucleotide exchange factor GrpE [Candidatus Dormibacteraeota bacterium]|nr:nucleotide exchange factor GrpE [Candidatus Dormibacteraeota bacterium]
MASKRQFQHDGPGHPDEPGATSVEASPPEEPSAAGTGTAESVAGEEPRPPVKEARPPVEEARPPVEEARPSEAERRAEELASRLEEANNQRIRLAADFDNFKKRARQEQMDTMRYAAATVAERLLPVADDADRVLSHAPDGVDENWLKGVRLTFQKLDEVLASLGVERIESVGSAFDPKLHEAVASEETAEHPEDTVVVELRPGYRMHDRVLRPALVKVARPPA